MTADRLDRRTLLVAAAAYAVLAMALTFPLALHLDQVPHDLGDPLLSTTLLWWNAQHWPLSDTWWNGPWFHPAPGSLAFSDPRLGASLVTTPLQWVGMPPLAAYNLALIASFPLCALAAFALAWRLTGRRDAAAIAGLAFGFTPYRIAHIEHLELLLAYGMPLALYALHRYADTRRAGWLVALAGALLLQGLSSSYYLLFFAIFMAAWLLWFLRLSDRRALAAITVASLGGVALLTPIYLGMWRIHRLYAFDRSSEVENFSADVSSFLSASPLLALWGWTSRLNDIGERQTFMGLTIIVLAMAGAFVAARGRRIIPGRWSRVARLCGVLATIVLLIGIAAALWGPFDWRVGPVRLTVTVFHKTFSIAVILAVIGVACSARVRDAWERRSPLAFYGLVTLLLLLCSLGPRPRAFGFELLYQPPYAWLMALPGFSDSIRVPARFTMPAALALSLAGAFAYTRLAQGRRLHAAVPAALLLLIALDTWPRTMPLIQPPAPWQADVSDVSAVLELPLGLVEFDSAAMYRSIAHRAPTINGMSGAAPPHYRALSRALLDRDPHGLEAISQVGPLLVAARENVAERDSWPALLDRVPHAQKVGTDGSWSFYRLAPVPEASSTCAGLPVRPVAVQSDEGPVPLDVIADGNPATTWFSRYEAPRSETLTLDLGQRQHTCALVYSLGSVGYAYAPQLAIDASDDGVTWRPVHETPLAALAIRSALRNQADARMTIEFPPVEARWLRLRRTATEAAPVWVVAELSVIARSGGS